MAWTSPHTWSVSEKVTAALLNTHLRDNLQFVFDVITGASATKIPNTAFTDNTINGGKLLDGTILDSKVASGLNGAKISAGSMDGSQAASTWTFPGVARFVNDANFYANLNADGPWINFDTGVDLFQFFRALNEYRFYIANAMMLSINGNGKLAGAGFYDSGEVTVANGVTQSFNTGFANGGAGALNEGPRFVSGVWGAAGNCNNPITDTGTVKWSTRSNTIVNVTNSTGSSQVMRVWAITNV